MIQLEGFAFPDELFQILNSRNRQLWLVRSSGPCQVGSDNSRKAAEDRRHYSCLKSDLYLERIHMHNVKFTCEPLVTTLRAVVSDPRRTCKPMAMLRAYPVNRAFEAYFVFSAIAFNKVGSNRSATVFSRREGFNRKELGSGYTNDRDMRLYLLLNGNNPIKVGCSSTHYGGRHTIQMLLRTQ